MPLTSSEKMAIIANQPFGKKYNFCTKVGYNSLVEADYNMMIIQNKRKFTGSTIEGKGEKRIYFCNDCRKYHLTSKERKTQL